MAAGAATMGRFCFAALIASVVGSPTSAAAESQAKPDFPLQVSCSDLRRAVDSVDAESEGRLQLSVAGRLTAAEFDGTVAYLAMCDSPDPKVLCIAYGTNGLQVGDPVVLSGGVGGYRRVDAEHILLDPCLPSAD